MLIKNKHLAGMFILVIIFIGLINFISAPGETSYCCERLTKNDDARGAPGAWCQNAPEKQCHANYRKVPTSCEATSYCKLGTCYNSNEGTCMENTPQKVCELNKGIWKEGAPDSIPQCQLGCCLIGEQAAFVTLTRCRSLAGVYGLEINYRTDIQSEVECIMSASPDVKGACVIDNGIERTCKFATKKECQDIRGSPAPGESTGGFFGGLFGGGDQESQGSLETNIEFHEGFLCSDENLSTNCARTKKTTCVEGRDEVYFVDSCGNLANIYDASKVNDPNYWKEIYSKAESCSLSDQPQLSPTDDAITGYTIVQSREKCGNCDYYSGSTCKSAKSGDNPTYGNNICKDLGCEYEGHKYRHGETWCADSRGKSEIIVNESGEIQNSEFNPEQENIPGSRYFRMVCYNNEISVEPCAEFRNEVCIESEVGKGTDKFKTAACRVNMWQDCVAQDNKDDCVNTDKRDCQWIDSGEKDNGDTDRRENKVCVPKYAPGFNFWEEGTDAESLCGLASTTCQVKYEKKLGDSWECVDNCECLKKGTGQGAKGGWETDKINLCKSLGDCGWKDNYLGNDGFNKQFDGLTGKSWTK